MANIDVLWDDNPIDITAEANFIWSIANKLRGSFMPDKYGDVIIPFTVIRRFECTLEDTKEKVVEAFAENPQIPDKVLKTISGYQFFNTSKYSLRELCNDSGNIKDNLDNYIDGFSFNVKDILKELDIKNHIAKMDKDNCLYSVVEAFSELELHPGKVDSIKMGYIFENLIGRFYQNIDAGQFYTGRDIIKTLVSVLISEGCDDIFEDHKIITVLDQACGTGGMLTTAYSYLMHYNPTADVKLFGQEFMGQTYAVGLAEMLIKGQNADNFRKSDTFKEDCFVEKKMRFVLENPPFGTPWGGKDAKEGQEDAVKNEYSKTNSRWGAGLPGTGDGQLLFMQSAINKLDPELGRAAIIENGSPLFTGSTSSGESQIRRWMLESDLIEAIIALPTELFYNTGIQTYAWILSRNKSQRRKGKVQLIDASSICHKLRKSVGNKRNEFLPEDRKRITELYTAFEENEYSKIFPNEEFMYREYAVMQPLQRSYSITKERIEEMLSKGALSSLYDEGKLYELENSNEKLNAKQEKQLASIRKGKPIYDDIIERLNNAVSDAAVYLSPKAFSPVIDKVLEGVDRKWIAKVSDGLSVMDKNAEIQRDKKGAIIYDKESKDTEIVKFNDDIDDYMKREVLPHVPDAKWFFEEDPAAKVPVVKTGAEIPFTRYFYKYTAPEEPEVILERIKALELEIDSITAELAKGDTI